MSTVLNFVPPSVAPASSSAAQIATVFERQRATALRLRESTVQERIAKIRKLRDAVLANKQAFYEAGEADFRKPPMEVDLAEILPIAAEANDAMRHLKRWMKPRRVPGSRATLGLKGWMQYQPKGRCLIIAPWNYPVNLCLGPLVSAIAAGNTAILKPSEMTPHLSAVMARIVRELFPEDEVALFEGDASVSQALLDLPFDHIFFTGSPAIGKVVMAAAAKHLTSVTLELGGKSPTIIDKTADLKAAATNLMWSKFTNVGQTCIAPDHVFVHADVKDAFVAACRERLEHYYGADGPARKACPYLARVVNTRHTARIKSLLDDARSRGARVLVGGDVDEAQCWISPTLLEGIPDDAKIMKEEIFGPLLPIIPYTDLDAVIARINADEKPLALYIWSRTQAVIDKVMNRTSSGGACINNSVVQFLHGNLPFGGVNNSGLGSAHGHFGFKAFSHERAVVRTQFDTTLLLRPPYSDLGRKVLQFMQKIV